MALSPIPTDVSVPIYLIRKRQEGWDLIAPKGWGMPILNLLVFAGTRVIGLKQSQLHNFERKMANFPQDFPESQCYNLYFKEIQELEEKKNLARPPGKRLYFRNRIESPFKPEFEKLNGFNFPTVNVFHSQKVLNLILENVKSASFDIFVSNLSRDVKNLLKSRKHFSKMPVDASVLSRMFVRVFLLLPSGNAKKNSIIHLKIDKEVLDAEIPADFIIGYTTSASYSLSAGRWGAFGLCTLEGLHRLYSCDPKKLLFLRSPTDRKSRKCYLELRV